jgi:hypothetical protein
MTCYCSFREERLKLNFYVACGWFCAVGFVFVVKVVPLLFCFNDALQKCRHGYGRVGEVVQVLGSFARSRRRDKMAKIA